jgi:thioesterase domain-containing protein
MTPDAINAYLHQRIPLSVHMQMQVLVLEPDRIEVRMPLAPNRNPHGTVFGGALSALGLVSGWMLLHAALEEDGLPAALVGQQSHTDFLAPAAGDCVAECVCPRETLDRLRSSFRERRRARLSLDTLIRVGALPVARHAGVYVALQEKITA